MNEEGGLVTGPEWNKAHDLCQTAEGEHAYDLVRALVMFVILALVAGTTIAVWGPATLARFEHARWHP